MSGKNFPPCELRGWLTKRGQKNKTWKKRFIVVTRGALRYYKTSKDAASGSEPLGSVPLESSKVCLPPPDANVGRPHTFCIMTDTMAGGRTLWCALDSEGARDLFAQNIAYYAKLCGGVWPVFGCRFSDIHVDGAAGEHEVPLFVSRCVDHVDRNGLDVEGVYRLSGQFQKISDAKAMLNSGKDVDFAAIGQDVHVVAGLLKQWLRELEEPLLTFDLYDKWVAAGRENDPAARGAMLVAAAKELPQRNLSTLRTIVYHLGRVEAKSSVNKMTAENLGVVFGPNLLRGGSEESMASMATDSRAVVTAVASLIENRETVFASLPPEIECLTAVSVFPAPPGAMGHEVTDKELGGSLVDYFARPSTAPVRKYTAHRSLAATAAAATAAASTPSARPPPPPTSAAVPPVASAQPVAASGASPSAPAASQLPPPPPPGSQNQQQQQQQQHQQQQQQQQPQKTAISHLAVGGDERTNKRLSSAIIFTNARLSIGRASEANQYVDNDSDDDDDDVPPPPDASDPDYIPSVSPEVVESLQRELVNLRKDFLEVVSMLERERARGDGLEQRIFHLEHKMGD